MPSIKVIKRRIATVTTTKQVMKAMDMVAASKLQKVRARLDRVRPLFEESRHMIREAAGSGASSPYVAPRPVKNTAYILITSDRGLCGSYNTNVSEEAMRFISERQGERIIAVGMKGWEYFIRRKKTVIERFLGISENANYEDAVRVAELLISLFESGEVDEAYLVYTRFESSLTYVPCVAKLLPIEGNEEGAEDAWKMRYDPDINTFLAHAIPVYIKSFIYGAMVESSTCEQAARMVSMSAASNNATEIIDTLTRAHNRLRQASITQEINEIISGADMLS